MCIKFKKEKEKKALISTSLHISAVALLIIGSSWEQRGGRYLISTLVRDHKTPTAPRPRSLHVWVCAGGRQGIWQGIKLVPYDHSWRYPRPVAVTTSSLPQQRSHVNSTAGATHKLWELILNFKDDVESDAKAWKLIDLSFILKENS